MVIRAVGIPLNDFSQSCCIIKSLKKLGSEQKVWPIYLSLSTLLLQRASIPCPEQSIIIAKKWHKAYKVVYEVVQVLPRFVIMGKYFCLIGKIN